MDDTRELWGLPAKADPQSSNSSANRDIVRAGLNPF